MAAEKSKKRTERRSSLDEDKTPLVAEQVNAVNKWMNELLGEDYGAEGFIGSLDDGARLCRLLRRYTKDQVADFKPKPHTPDHYRLNFRLFTQCCQSAYNLPVNECFTRRDLTKDPGAVVLSLYALSKKLRAVLQKTALPICDPTPFGDVSANVDDSQNAAIDAEDAKNDDVDDAADNAAENSADDAKDEFKYEADEPKNDYAFKGRVSNGPKGGSAGRRGKKDGFRNYSAKENIRAQKRAKQSKYALKPESDDE